MRLVPHPTRRIAWSLPSPTFRVEMPLMCIIPKEADATPAGRSCGWVVRFLIIALTGLACDPAIGTTLRLTPSPPPADTSMSPARPGADAAFEAVGRVARAFGLAPAPDSDRTTSCVQQWLRPGNRRQTAISICARRRQDGVAEVVIGEAVTTRWSPLGDSLRRAVADTLARYGRVSIPQ